MYKQTGDELVFGADGLLKRGLVIRLLVLPNDIAGVRESLEWIKDTLSPLVAVSLMAQYYATNRAATDERYTLLSRRITESEWLRALRARRTGNGRRLDAGIRRRSTLLSPGLHKHGCAVQRRAGFQINCALRIRVVAQRFCSLAAFAV
jgi:hypothetical protein